MINNIKIHKDLIKELREKTGISIIKCKQALIKAHGNIQLAIDNLRKSELKSKFSKLSRPTNFGLIMIKMESNFKKGLILEINCETDFVSKNSVFGDFAKTVITTALRESIEDINILKERFKEQLFTLMQKIDEKIQINRFMVLTGNFVHFYVHRTKIGVLVSSNKKSDPDVIRNIAMHIAAKNPKYIFVNDIPDDIIRHERSIQTEIALKFTQSPKILEKIVEGRMQKFINEIVLTKQEFILDTNINVMDVLNKYQVKINNFIRFEIGEHN